VFLSSVLSVRTMWVFVVYVVGVHNICSYCLWIVDTVETIKWSEGKTWCIPELIFSWRWVLK